MTSAIFPAAPPNPEEKEQTMPTNTMTARDTISDKLALTSIARMLGTNPEWDSPADFLESIADIIAATGRQHPGDADPDTYNPNRTVTPVHIAPRRVPNPAPFEDASQIETYVVETARGPMTVSVNVERIAQIGQTVETHLAEFVEHQANNAAKENPDG